MGRVQSAGQTGYSGDCEVAVSKSLTYHGRPCDEGHTERYTSNNHCIVCNSFAGKKRRAALRKLMGPTIRIKNFGDRPKLCPSCKTVKEPSEFYKTRFGTLFTDCKDCRRIYVAEMWRTKYKKGLGKPLASVVR